MMVGLPDFLLDEDTRKRLEEMRQRGIEDRCRTAVPWDPEMPWKKHLTIQASTYRPLSLFPKLPVTECIDPNRISEEQRVVSEDRRWLYCTKRLPRGASLMTTYGRQRGTVMFDGPVEIPVLHYSHEDEGRWVRAPFMSLAPMEYFSLRIGTRLARGHTIVAGLGLGHQLIEVSRRKQVKSITLVEKSQALVDFILPRVRPHLRPDVPLSVIVQDVEQVISKLTGDVALIDIYPVYNGHRSQKERISSFAFGIKKVWHWGTMGW